MANILQNNTMPGGITPYNSATQKPTGTNGNSLLKFISPAYALGSSLSGPDMPDTPGVNAVNAGGRTIGHQFSTLDPNAQGAKDQLIQQLNSLLQGGTTPLLQGLHARSEQNFRENTVPSLSERFTAFGNGGQRSSAFTNALGRAGTDLEDQKQDQTLKLFQMLLGPSLQDQSVFQKSSPTFWESLSGGGGEAAGQILPLLMKILPLLLGA